MAEVQALPGGLEFMFEKVIYTAGDARGVIASVVMSCFSGVAVVGLLVVLAVSAWNTRKSVNPHLFVRSHMAAYFISLLLCDLLQAFGSILNTRWLSRMAITYGHYCTFQGVVKQTADVSMGIWSLLIAFHTFLVVFMRWNMPKRSLYIMFAIGWGLVGLIVLIGPAASRKADGPFYGISGYWCWISDNYGNERVSLDYMWLFFSALFSFILYTLVYLNLRGNVTTTGVHLRRQSLKSVDDQSVAIAKQMVIYPIAFTILIMPIAICRFIEWSGHAVPDAATSFSDSVFLMSGLVDVVLFAVTRRVLPKHSVLPRSVSLKIRKRRGPRPGDGGASFRIESSDVDLEKGEEKLDMEEGDAREVHLEDGMFKRAESPDDGRDEHEVTIRVQSVVVDRIYMQPGGTFADPRTPPGLEPASGMESVALDSARAVRAGQRDSTFSYTAKDLPALPRYDQPSAQASPVPEPQTAPLSVQPATLAKEVPVPPSAPAAPSPRRSMSESTRESTGSSYYTVEEPNPELTRVGPLRRTQPHEHEEPSPTDSHYTTEDEERSPSSVQTRGAPPRPLLLGSATFPDHQPPFSAGAATLSMSARLPPAGRDNWI